MLRLVTLTALILLLASAPASARSCAPRGSELQAASPKVAVFDLDADVYACRIAGGRRFRLGQRNVIDEKNYGVSSVHVAGRFVAYGMAKIAGRTIQYDDRLRLLDVASRKTVAVDNLGCTRLGEASVRLRSFAVSRAGGLAWSCSAPGASGANAQVRKRDACGETLLAQSDPTSADQVLGDVAIGGEGVVYWSTSSGGRSARLVPRAAEC